MVWRFLVVVAVAVWFGGFTFYSTAVIATAQKVLHSNLRSGLITQQVTNWLNLISLPALALCTANCITLRNAPSTRWWQILTAALACMVAMQFALFGFHPVLDRQIVNREVLDDAKFYTLHRVYLVISTAQWLSTLAYLWSSLMIWRAIDKRGGPPSHSALRSQSVGASEP